MTRFNPEKIKKIRRLTKINQKNMSELIGVKRQTISNWEGGMCIPNAYYVGLIADVLGVSVNDFYDT